MATLYLLRYNNYYNRTIKQEDNLTAYLTYAIPFSVSKTGIEGVNFNPNDGVNTTQIINWNNTVPDYLLVVDNNTIISRWFIIEMARTRGGQYKLTLRRDVIVDNYINVLNAHIFIDKAKVPDTDIAIYNKEPYKFNTIKKSETLLKDETGCAWIVGYLSQEIQQEQTSVPVKAFLSDTTVQYTYTNATDYFTSKFPGLLGTNVVNNRKIYYGTAELTFQIKTYANNTFDIWQFSNVASRRFESAAHTSDHDFLTQRVNGNTSIVYCNTMFNKASEQYEIKKASMIGYGNAKYNLNSSIPNFSEENGKIIYDSTASKYYVISVSPIHFNAQSNTVSSISEPGLWNDFESIRNACSGTEGTDTYELALTSNDAYRVNESEHDNYAIELVEIGLGLNVEIPHDSDRPHLTDAPYDMFCMPYSDSIKFYDGASLVGTSNKILNLAAAMSMVEAYAGAGAIYDVQLLPYCPLDDNYLTADGDIQIEGQTVGYIKRDDLIFGYVFFTQQSTFSFSIPVDITVDDYKMQHQLDNWRFNSPNWSGSYDFDVTLNKGLSYVDIDCTYKPYTPYIHVCPRFNASGYYGYNNKDAVGLICGGDFSLPMISDAWKTYEYQNKNYQNQFDRQIQNINTNYRLDSYERGANALAGAFSGAASGAVAGAMFGAGGAAIGAVAGGALSLGGGAADMVIAKERKEEAVSFATDQFAYQIDNIKSLPNTLTKVSALNGNNKLFPFIEYFSSSDQEKNIFRDLIQWNGMTVNRMGTLADFKVEGELNYFSGRLVRANVSDESHMVSAIANELSRGVFI